MSPFAIALKRLTGLPLAGVLDFDAEYSTTYLLHAFVEVNDDLILDVAGMRSYGRMMEDFMYWDPEPCNFTEKELIKWGGSKRYLDEEARTALNKASAVAAEILAIENQMAAIQSPHTPPPFNVNANGADQLGQMQLF